MKVSGEDAARYDVIRSDSFATVNRGELTEADDETGLVRWKDHVNPAEIKTATLGAHCIRIVPKSPYRR
jgi:hypothetical protein